MTSGWPNDLSWYRLLTDWGSIIGGGFALIAGAAAYIAGHLQAAATQRAAALQIEAEQRWRDQEVATLRKSIAIEARQMVARAFAAHNSLKGLVSKTDGPITARMIESSVVIPAAIVYPAATDRISILNNEAMDVIILYQLIEIGREYTNQLLRYRTPDNISVSVVALVAAAFLEACTYSTSIFPRLRTDIATHDEKDAELTRRIAKAGDAWRNMRQKT